MYPGHGATVPFRAEGVDAGSRVGGRSPRAPVRRRAQGGSRVKTVVRWSGATSRQCKRFQRETQARRGRAAREPTSQNVGSALGATAPRTQRTRDSPHPRGGRRSGLGAIATAAILERWRQPIKTPAKGGHHSPVARQTLGGRERSERGKRSRGRGAPFPLLLLPRSLRSRPPRGWRASGVRCPPLAGVFVGCRQ